MKYAKQNDLLAVLLALEERIMEKLQVATFAIVTKVDKITKTCDVRPFPINNSNKIHEITCKYIDSLEEQLTYGTIVIVLFMDKDFRNNLTLIESGSLFPQEKPPNSLEHSDSNGVIIQVFKTKEVM